MSATPPPPPPPPLVEPAVSIPPPPPPSLLAGLTDVKLQTAQTTKPKTMSPATAKQATSSGPDSNKLMEEIRSGRQLKKTVTNDKSKPKWLSEKNAKGNTTPAMSNRIPTAAEENAPPVDLADALQAEIRNTLRRRQKFVKTPDTQPNQPESLSSNEVAGTIPKSPKLGPSPKLTPSPLQLKKNVVNPPTIETLDSKGLISNFSSSTSIFLVPETSSTGEPNDIRRKVEADDEYDPFDKPHRNLSKLDIEMEKEICNEVKKTLHYSDDDEDATDVNPPSRNLKYMAPMSQPMSNKSTKVTPSKFIATPKPPVQNSTPKTKYLPPKIDIYGGNRESATADNVNQQATVVPIQNRRADSVSDVRQSNGRSFYPPTSPKPTLSPKSPNFTAQNTNGAFPKKTFGATLVSVGTASANSTVLKRDTVTSPTNKTSTAAIFPVANKINNVQANNEAINRKREIAPITSPFLKNAPVTSLTSSPIKVTPPNIKRQFPPVASPIMKTAPTSTFANGDNTVKRSFSIKQPNNKEGNASTKLLITHGKPNFVLNKNTPKISNGQVKRNVDISNGDNINNNAIINESNNIDDNNSRNELMSKKIAAFNNNSGGVIPKKSSSLAERINSFNNNNNSDTNTRSYTEQIKTTTFKTKTDNLQFQNVNLNKVKVNLDNLDDMKITDK